jgi:hypothetical protein
VGEESLRDQLVSNEVLKESRVAGSGVLDFLYCVKFASHYEAIMGLSASLAPTSVNDHVHQLIAFDGLPRDNRNHGFDEQNTTALPSAPTQY